MSAAAPTETGGAPDAGLGFALRYYWRRLHSEPLGFVGFWLVVIMVLSAIFAPWIVPYDPTAIVVGPNLGAPSAEHWMGTDHLGRDTFSRVIMGGRVALLVAFTALAAALLLGVVLGLLAGFGPRWLDNALLLLFDTVRSFPVIIFALALVALMGPSLVSVIVVVAITTVPIYARIVRTQTLSLRNSEFILAERAMGASFFRIISVHIMPNVVGPLLILASMDVPMVITLEAGLSFLGMGVQPPTPSWGSILNDGYSYIRNTPWVVVFGGLPIVLMTLGFTFFGEALRDIFDPKLQRDL